MNGGLTVLGLLPEGCLIDDLRLRVPYRETVQIPLRQAQRSKSLWTALQQQHLLQLGNAPLPTMAKEPPPLAPILRGRGIAPHNPVVTQDNAPSLPREILVKELEASRQQCQQLQKMNDMLQASLDALTEQLSQIRETLQGLSPTRATVIVREPRAEASPVAFTSDVPHFIAPTNEQAAEVRISIPESTSESDLGEARGALRSLRKKTPG